MAATPSLPLRYAVVLALGVALPVACADQANQADGKEGAGARDGDGDGDGSGAGGVEKPPCEGPLGPPQDPAKLPECCPEYGEAHCVEDVPSEFQTYVSACEGGGYCVPDDFTKTGGVFTPKSCVAFDGSDGVCLSACISKIAEVASVLQQGECKASERCAPCVFGGMDTGACDISFSCDDPGAGASTGSGPACDDPATCEYDCADPAIPPETFPPCTICGGGHCVPTSQIPDPSLVDQLASCDATSVCVPDEFIMTNGKFTAPTCKSVGGFEGRCLSACLPQVIEQADQLPQDSCTDTQKCVPCYDPLSGEDTGACKVSCDKGPAGPPETFAKCCPETGGGLCLPAEQIPAEQQEQLGQDTCAQDSGASLCVPQVFVDAQQSGVPYLGKSCDTGFWIKTFFGDEFAEGGCMPRCIPEVEDAPFLSDSDCDPGFDCVPCNNPQTGEPSGACEPQGA